MKNDLRKYSKDNSAFMVVWVIEMLTAILRKKDTHVWTWISAPRTYGIFQNI